MSQREREALLAFFHSFGVADTCTEFEELADGRLLWSVMKAVDPAYFKTTQPHHRQPSVQSDPSSSKGSITNNLRSLYRLLLSYPLPPPHPHHLAIGSFPEPDFTSIARSPDSPKCASGLVQLCRLCLAIGVWAPGNEKVIGQIQSLPEEDMAALMRSIEEVMAALPTSHEELLKDAGTPGAKIGEEQVVSSPESSLSPLGNSTRAAKHGSTEVDALRADLSHTEESLMVTEADLNKQTELVTSLQRKVEELRLKAEEAGRLRHQLDEYRHAADRLRKSENVVEKYKKKLEDAAGLRREFRTLEAQNAVLVNANCTLEAEVKRWSASKPVQDDHLAQIDGLEQHSDQQAREIVGLRAALEMAGNRVSEAETAYQRDHEELLLHQERVRQLEQGATPGLNRRFSSMDILAKQTTLEDEIGGLLTDENGAESTIDLRLRIRALERELAETRSSTVRDLGTENTNGSHDRKNNEPDRSDKDVRISDDSRRGYLAEISEIKEELRRAKSDNLEQARRHKLEQQLMLSAWHELGSRTVRDHINTASVKRSAVKPMPMSWLGRQRRHQEDASFSR